MRLGHRWLPIARQIETYGRANPTFIRPHASRTDAVCAGSGARNVPGCIPAGVGPMAAVAGAISEAVGRTCWTTGTPGRYHRERRRHLHEDRQPAQGRHIRGGFAAQPDICCRDPAGGYAARHMHLSRQRRPLVAPWEADAAVILCRDAALADAFATATANRVQGKKTWQRQWSLLWASTGSWAQIAIMGDKWRRGRTCVWWLCSAHIRGSRYITC